MSYSQQADERRNPSAVKAGDNHEACRSRPLVLLRFLAVLVVLPLFWIQVVPQVPLPLWQSAVVVIAATLMYVAVAYLVSGEADLDNLFPTGGPYDMESNSAVGRSRALLYAQCLLGPGRFIAESLLDMRIFFAEEAVAEETESKAID